MTDFEPTITPAEGEPDEPGPKKKTSRHKWIMRGVVTPAFGLLAVASFAFGALNYTIWKPNPQVTATSASISQRYIVTDPGVANLGDPKVDIKVTSTSQSVCVALGEARDVAGWVSGQSYTRVTGLSDWQHLTVEDASTKTSGNADTDESNDVNFDQSDMWSQVKCGSGTLDVNWDISDGNQVLLIDTQAKTSAGAGAAQPDAAQLGDQAKGDTTLAFTWVRSKVLDLGTPFMVAGGLLTVAAVATATVFAMEAHRRRNKRTLAAVPVAQPVNEDEPPAWTRGAKPANADVELTLTGMMKPIDAPLALDSSADGPAIVDVRDVNMLERTAVRQSSVAVDDSASVDDSAGVAGSAHAQSDHAQADHAQSDRPASIFARPAEEPARPSAEESHPARGRHGFLAAPESSAGPAADAKFDASTGAAGPIHAGPAATASGAGASGAVVFPDASGTGSPFPAASTDRKGVPGELISEQLMARHRNESMRNASDASRTGSMKRDDAEQQAEPVLRRTAPSAAAPTAPAQPAYNRQSADRSSLSAQSSSADSSAVSQSQPQPGTVAAAQPPSASQPQSGTAQALASLVNATPAPNVADELSNVEITAEGEAISQTPEFDDYFSRLVHETQEIAPIDDEGKPKRNRRSRREMREARERMKKEGGRK